jgi:dipeptidyl aminopeptidase/acylaminoacyl peptidase
MMGARGLAVAAFLAVAALSSNAESPPRGRGVTTDDLIALRDLGGPLRPRMSISPDGARVALFERATDLAANDYEYTLITIDLRTGHKTSIASAGGIILRSLNGYRSGAPVEREAIWSPDQEWIYYLRARETHVEIWRARSDGSAEEPVVVREESVRRFALINGGRTLAYETATPRAAFDAQRVAIETRGLRIGGDFSALSGLGLAFDEDVGARIWRHDLATGETSAGVAGDMDGEGLTPEARIAPIDPGARVHRPALGLSYAASGDEIRCTHAACSGALEEAWANAEARGAAPVVAFRRLEDRANSEEAIYVWTPRDGHVRLAYRARVRLEACAMRALALYCLQQSSLQPRRFVRIDLRSGALEILYDPNPQWRALRLPRVERLYYTDGEGNQSFADLVYPTPYRRAQRYPLVVVQYRSRGFLRGGTGEETPILPLSSLGYFVLSVDRPEFVRRGERLSLLDLSRETELDDSEHRRKREAILAFIDMASERGRVDRARLGISGLSDGAETLYDMMSDAPIFAAAIAGSPPNDPLGWSLQSSAFRMERRESLGITPPWDDASPEWSAWWRENTPANHAARMRAALMLNLSDAEALRAFPFIARLQETPTPIETYLYPGAYHLKWRPSQLQAAQERTIAWFEFWLRGRLVADENDPERADRWRALQRRQG